MPNNSEIILSQQTHATDSNTETVTGDKFKGDGYYGRSDGLHTVQYSYNDFSGTVTIQATLAIEPTEDDWFDVHSRTVVAGTDSHIENFTGNYVWIKANLSYTDGTVNSIKLNH